MTESTGTLTLTDFLLARIAEDHAAADLVLRPYGEYAASNDADWWTSERGWFDMGLSSDETPLLLRMTPQRVLAECAAKREMVTQADAAATCGGHDPEWYAEFEQLHGTPAQRHLPDEYAPGCDGCAAAESVAKNDAIYLRMMAAVYADHPDYRQEWKP